MFFLVAVRKGDKFNDKLISLLNSFLWFLDVETKWQEDKIRLPAECLAVAKNARSENRGFAGFPARIFFFF